MRVLVPTLLTFGLACATTPGAPDAGDAGEAAGRTDPILPTGGAISNATVNCTSSYALPAALTGADGLGRFGWTVDDTKLRGSWPYPSRFVNRWISASDDAVPSARVRPWLVPSAGYCLQAGLAARAPGGLPALAAVLEHVSAFQRRDRGLDALLGTMHTPPQYDLSGGNVLARAIAGLFATPNPLPGAPVGFSLSEEQAAALRQTASAYPPAAQEALARLVLAIGEAAQLKQLALSATDLDAAQRIHAQFLADDYSTYQNTFVSPSGGTVVADMIAHAESVDLSALAAAAASVGRAVDEARAALASIGPFEAEVIDVFTSHGRITISPRPTSDAWTADEVDMAALIVDLGGNDTYEGRYASTPYFWMSASVVLDLSGDDRYGQGVPDIEAAATTAAQAFDASQGFTQGAGLFGVGILVDGAGNDEYRASVFSQGASAFGVGVLADHGGADWYRVGNMGQGAGFFGSGVLVDASGDDHYRAYSLGQGLGKPAAVGLLLDLAGHDEYLGYNAEHAPHLPGSGVKNYYGLPTTWAYGDGEKPHYMSLVQGVGWGYRGDWFPQPYTNWAGGFGALVDLGAGNDTHTADTFSMGQGFVYGLGFLFDGGGDDRYRSFWWGPGAAAHMGVGLFVDEAGNDDLYVTRASGGFGYDWSVAWTIDRGGNDTYGGQFHYGEGYTWGDSFFVNEGGDDTYNAGGTLGSPMFGGIRTGEAGVKLIGAFLDLGGGADTYVNAAAGVGNGLKWYPEPVAPKQGQALDPANHKGIGIDE